MPKHPEYKIITGFVRPPRKHGRLPSANNDDELIARALAGIKNGTYRSYRAAATALAPESRTYHKGKYWTPESAETIIDRLRRKISAAHQPKATD